MGKARDLARVIVDSGGLIAAGNLGNAVPADGSITNAKIASMAASKLTGQVPDANAPSGSVIQVQSLTYTDTFVTGSSQTTRIPVTNFFIDITPMSTSSKIIVMAHLAVGWSDTPEWSWFIDRTVGGTTTQIGTSAYVGNRMNGYHGGPQDSGAQSMTYDVYSYSHCVVDSPATTSSIRYQVCMQDRWVNYTNKYINRSGADDNNGYITRGSSSITVMEIAQ